MLDNIEIIDYKCFKDFKLDGISQINIISGGNNVGKTALLEAILLIENTNDLRTFIKAIKYIFKNRSLTIHDVDNYFAKLDLTFTVNGESIIINHQFIDKLNKIQSTEIQNYNNDEFILLTKNNELSQIIPFFKSTDQMNLSIGTYTNTITPFLNSSKPNNKQLTQLYSKIQDLEIQDEFLKYLQIIDENIVSIEPQVKSEGESSLRVTLQHPKQSLLSSELGEGTNRFIEILITILTNKNKVIFIDEIENGIHYSKLKDIWKAIITIVQKENIQLFVTTHDKDTIEALVEASQEEKYKDIASIKLIKNKENKIKPIVMNYENLLFGTEMGEDFR